MTFEEATTIPSVYLCSLYAIYHLGNLREGQIFVTVGTPEKRRFLEKEYGISQDRMFSSRTTEFAESIIEATGGHGVDVIINSLTGELMDASWRLMADGGTTVEIGKRDILDRNTLAMEPFDRNCSFRAVDMSYAKHMDDHLVAILFNELFALIETRCIKPINPITIFGFDNIAGALSLIRSGRHIGKIVISNFKSGQNDVQLPIRPAARKLRLRPDVCYLIVGGVRGACGTLAIHMAQHGAKKIIINSRSGITADEISARIISSYNLHRCEIIDAKGDVADISYVRQLFKSARPRIAGVIQGAMVDYHTAVRAKVIGAKNIHEASEEMRKQDQTQTLDFFTMLSSISGIFGNKGQANYAAANTFLDAFASYRRSRGLQAHTVDLGIIEDIGYLAGSALQSRFDKHLWTPINERTLRKILTYSILQQDSVPLNASSCSQMITGINYPLPFDNPELLSNPRFAYLFNKHAAEKGDNKLLQDVADYGDKTAQPIKLFHHLLKSGAETASVTAACVEAISLQIEKYLQLETAVKAGRPLIAYGMDSLSAVELRNWIREKLGVELTTLDITSASTLLALCEKVIGKSNLL
ncbi:KR domain-containing protein [Xylaria arbuscula]|nr:KR domain-containing protein [Xylaria arbuscula]